MHSSLLERYAALLVHYCVRVSDGDAVLLDLGRGAEPLARPLVRAVLEAGGDPALRLSYPEYAADLVELTSEASFARSPKLELAEIGAADASIRVDAPHNAYSLAGLPSERVQRLAARRAEVVRQRTETTRWVSTLYPTASAAQSAGMRLDAFERFVARAMFIDDGDPVARWTELRETQAAYVERLSRADVVHLQGPGTDLRLSVRGRTWVNSDGRRNMPSGEVFTGPIEDSAEGSVTFDLPSAVDGVIVRGVRLLFRAGRVVEASADEGEETLLAKLDCDAGARALGELGIGTNFAITTPILNTLFDEKIGGTFHLALGRSYRETGGTNQSALHWDLVTDLRGGGRIELDGEPFMVDGRFV
jgi:aminopeptidase